MGTFVSSPNQSDQDFTLEDDLPLTPQPKPEDIEIQYVDSRTPEEKQYEVNTVDEGATRWDREDKKQYGKNVRDRLSKMDYRIHQAERERDAAARERDALTQHAQQLAAKVQELESREKKWGDVALDATRNQVDGQITAVKQEIAQLLQSPHPDVTKVVDSQERLATLTAQRMQVSSMAAAPERVDTPPPAPPAGPLKVPTYEADRERWLVVNPWFGKELEKTQRLIDIEQRLVRDGVVMGSRAYWEAIERAKGFVMQSSGQGSGPSRTGSPSQSQTRTVVTGSSGAAPPSSNGATTTGGRRVVQLTQDERRAAARMGVSEQDWALEKLKREEKQRAQR
jgi:hypothetical protein